MSYIYQERFAKLYDKKHLLTLDMHESRGEGTPVTWCDCEKFSFL